MAILTHRRRYDFVPAGVLALIECLVGPRQELRHRLALDPHGYPGGDGDVPPGDAGRSRIDQQEGDPLAARPLGVNLYLIDGGTEWVLIDIGEEDILDEVIELIRAMDFPLSKCKMVIATHADADHVQALNQVRERLKTKTAAHAPSGDLFGWSQNVGMGLQPELLGRAVTH